MLDRRGGEGEKEIEREGEKKNGERREKKGRKGEKEVVVMMTATFDDGEWPSIEFSFRKCVSWQEKVLRFNWLITEQR